MQNFRFHLESLKVYDFARRFLLLNVGLFLFALGSVEVIQAGLGYVSWDVFHRGLSLHIQPVTFGQAAELTGLVIIGLGLLLGIKPGIGTVMNMLMIGFWLDQILSWKLIPSASPIGWWASIILLGLGIFTIGLGSGLYIKAGMGAGPRDGLMLGLSARTGLRVGLCRAIIEITVCIIGALLGGPVGIGTVVVAFSIGPAVELGFWLFRVQDPRKQKLQTAPVSQ